MNKKVVKIRKKGKKGQLVDSKTFRKFQRARKKKVTGNTPVSVGKEITPDQVQEIVANIVGSFTDVEVEAIRRSLDED